MLQITVIALCLLVNAVFSSIEMAFVTVGKPELRKKAKRGDEKARRLLKLRENPEKALSVIQIGITLVGAISAAVGGAGAEESLSPWLQRQFTWSEPLAESVAIAIVIIPLTYLSVVIGELVPKTVALRYPNQVLAFGTSVLHLGIRILGPLVSILDSSTRLILRIMLPKLPAAVPDQHTELDLRDLSTHQRQYILNLANIEMKKVRDALLPWQQVVWIEQAASFESVVQKVIESGHTRLPVLDENGLRGILHSKEFLAFAASGNRDWHSILRPAVVVKPNEDLLKVLRKLQDQKRHMAVVLDNVKLLGVITFE